MRRRENRIIADHGEWIDVDVSTDKNKNATMMICRCDWERLQKIDSGRWYAIQDGNSIYVNSNMKLGRKRQHIIQSHREILSAPKNMQVDHINGNGLDNRRSNLRICSQSDNCKNRAVCSTSSTGVSGISWNKNKKRFVVGIGVSGKWTHIGTFEDFIDAIYARKNAERAFFGEFARK